MTKGRKNLKSKKLGKMSVFDELGDKERESLIFF